MVEEFDSITPHTVLTAGKIESLLEKERDKYMKIINHLTDKIKEAGCDLEHPFDRDSMTVSNTLANSLQKKLDKIKTRLDISYRENKISKFEYEFMLLIFED